MSAHPALAILIATRALCRNCIAAETRMTPDGVDAAIMALSRNVKIDRYARGTCRDCRAETLVFAIDRPGGAAPSGPFR